MPSSIRRLLRTSFFLLVFTALLPAVEADALATAQTALQDERPADALAALGPAVTADADFADEAARERAAVAASLRGRALAMDERFADARDAYRRALAWDPELLAAAEGLIHSLTQLQDWRAVQAVANRWALRPDSRPELLLIAIDAAHQRDDQLLALDLARLGVARQPDDQRFRLRRAESLAAVGDHLGAEQAWRELVRSAPADATWWRNLAAMRQSRGDAVAARRALAVAHANDPHDAALAQGYLVSLLAAEHAVAALSLAETLVAGAAAPDGELLLLAVRAAWQAEELALARDWLGRVPEAARTVDWQRWSLQLAVAADDRPAARQAAEQLITLGAAGNRIRLHAAGLAEAAGDRVAAEAHLRHVLQSDEADLMHLARLHLARLLIGGERLDEAERLVRAALDARPTDGAAARLHAAVRRAQLAAAQGE